MIRSRSRRPPELELREKLRDLASRWRFFGYRRLFVLLRGEEELSGINRIYRKYREEGLIVGARNRSTTKPRLWARRGFGYCWLRGHATAFICFILYLRLTSA